MKLEKVMRTENGQDETKTEKIKREKKLGGLKTLPFILANEVSERFATTGFQANMITYLTQQLNMPVVKSSNIVTNFNGTAGFTPLIGALIADSLVGRFWMVILGSMIYELGFGALILSAVVPGLRPPPCPSQTNCKEASSRQVSILYISLLLTALGLGGMRPCLVTFAADQFDMSKSKTESRKWNLFNWYCFFLEIGNLTALTILVYIQDNVGWGLGLGIPAIVMAFSVIVFVSGTPFYKKEKPKGSPLVRLAQVIVASIRKRKVVVPDEPGLLFESKELDAAISSGEKLIHTNGFQWLDKAAVITEADRVAKVPNLWRLSTVHRVEELKSIVRMLPIWSTGILAITAYSHQDSFNILMGRTMDRHLTPSFEIPAATMLIFENLAILIGLPLYERLFVPFARKFTKNPNGITYLQRMGIGFTINILATLISAFMETKRKSVAEHHNLLDDPTSTIPMSVFWLVPQYSVHGLALVFITTGRVEFFYNQSPESMRSTSASFFWIALALGQYSGTYMVSAIHDYTAKGRDWIPNRNLNRGRLEYYFLFVSGLQVVNLVYFFICAKFYTYKAVEDITQGDVELSMAKIGENTKDDDNEVSEEIIKK